MSLVPLPLGLIGCCCCCPGDRPVPPGARVGDGTGPGTVPGFTSGEEDFLANAARSWFRDTGRTCGDFFQTLLTGGRADAFLAGRPTLLTKAGSLEALEALFLSTTICARVGVPPPRVMPQLRRPPSMAPTIIVAQFRNLDPFGTPTGVGFRGTTGEYFAWKNGLAPRSRGGLRFTARREFDGSVFDEFCHGPACP